MSDKTVAPYRKDKRVENVFGRVNELLYGLEKDLVQRHDTPRYPVVFIAGTQRSGTTLTIQLMRASFEIGYISNLIARFWQAPYIGALLMRELNPKQSRRDMSFVSRLGATYGYEGSHEFGFFWERWFPYNETHQTRAQDRAKIDYTLLRRELSALESVFESPMVFKNPIVFSLNITALASLFPTAVFIICRRDPLYVAQSTLLSRLEYFGSKEKWFSIKPAEYLLLKELPYYQQIAGQIFYTEKRIRQSLSEIDQERFIVIEYSDMCQNPEHELIRISQLVAKAGYQLHRNEFRPTPFENRNYRQVSQEELHLLKTALGQFQSRNYAKSKS